MKQVVLFNPSARGFEGEDLNFIVPPLSILGAASGIIDLPYKIIVIDEVFDSNYETILSQYKNNILLVGITALTGHQIKNALRFSEFMRKLNKNIPLVWGGYHPSTLPEQTLSDPRVDIVCIGQAPTTFHDLVLALDNKTPLTEVKGIGIKIDGKIIITKPRPITPMNELPRLPYEILDLNRYISDPAGTGERVMGYVSSQGCLWKCSFCAEVAVTKRKWTALEPKKVVDDFEYFQKNFGVTHITLYDSMFVANSTRVKEIVREIKARNLNISLGFINARTDQIVRFDDEFFELLKSINCTTFLIGAESGDDELLRSINKEATVAQTIEAKKRLSKYGFHPMFSFMLGLDFNKKNNKKEFNAILDVCDAIRTVDDNSTLNIWNYVPYAGTPHMQKAIIAGYKSPQTLEEYGDYNLSSTHVPWVDPKYNDILEMLRNMIFPYVSIQFKPGGIWDQNYKGRYKLLKKFMHRTIRTVCLLRLKYRFFSLPLDYYLFQNWQRIMRKNELVGQLKPEAKE